jgi:hypothetical protein
MLGPGALVGSSDFDAWYTPGAIYVYNAGQELVNSPDISHLDLPRYLSSFDALAQDARFDMSGMTANRQHQTLTSWYIDGTLNLKGFYFGNSGAKSWSSVLSYLLLSPHETRPLAGYLFKDGKLYRFQQHPRGDTVLLTAVCLRPALERMVGSIDPHAYGFFTLSLPKAQPSTQERSAIKVLLVERLKHDGLRPILAAQCKLRDEIWGTLGEVPVRSVLAGLRQEDRPITFYRTLTDAVMAANGILVTSDGQPFHLDRRAPLFAANFTTRWEATPAKSRIYVADDPYTAKFTTNYSAYDQQLVSSAIPVTPRATYLLEFELKIERGGAGVQVLTQDRRTTLAAYCEFARHQDFRQQRVFFKTDGHTPVILVVANCNAYGPTTSIFWIRNMRIWGQR